MTWSRASAAMAGTLLCLACATRAGSSGATAPANLSALVEDVMRSVGSVRDLSTAHRRAVVVFEERHSSIVGQLEMAVMLLRLHERGVRLVGLEGAAKGERLEGDWYRAIEAQEGPVVREQVALRLLLGGEISAAEFLALSLPGADVRGLEAPELHAVELTAAGWPEAGYLLRLAASALPPEQAAQLSELAARGTSTELSGKLLEADPWVKARWAEMFRADPMVEDVAARLQMERARVVARGVEVEEPLRRDFENALRFFETAARRSDVMAANLTGEMDQAGSSLCAMVIGAAHGRGVRAALERAAMNVVSIRPASFSTATRELSELAHRRKSRRLWAGDGGWSPACVLNASRKPPPIITTATARARLWAEIIVATLARAVRDHRDLTKMGPALPKSPEGAVLSIRADDSDVVLQLSLTDTAGQRIPLWVRARARGGLDGAWSPNQSLEQKLLALIAREHAGGSVNDAADEPGATLIGPDVRAVFGAAESEVTPRRFKEPRPFERCSGKAS